MHISLSLCLPNASISTTPTLVIIIVISIIVIIMLADLQLDEKRTQRKRGESRGKNRGLKENELLAIKHPSPSSPTPNLSNFCLINQFAFIVTLNLLLTLTVFSHSACNLLQQEMKGLFQVIFYLCFLFVFAFSFFMTT